MYRMHISEPEKKHLKCCSISALQRKGDIDHLEVDDIEEICEQLRPAFEKYGEFASYNQVSSPDDDKSGIQYRGYVLIRRAVLSIMDEKGNIPKQPIAQALRKIDNDLANGWSQRQPG